MKDSSSLCTGIKPETNGSFDFDLIFHLIIDSRLIRCKTPQTRFSSLWNTLGLRNHRNFFREQKYLSVFRNHLILSPSPRTVSQRSKGRWKV